MPEKYNVDNIELRSEEVQDILGQVPRWIVRWGITLVLIILLGILVGSYFFKYPDLINARITILSQNPPVKVIAIVNGRLDQLFIHDNQKVIKNELIGIIENPANYKHVFELKRKLDSIEVYFTTPDSFESIKFPSSSKTIMGCLFFSKSVRYLFSLSNNASSAFLSSICSLNS